MRILEPEGLLIPRLHFTDPAHEFFIYDYTIGDADHNLVGPKSEWLTLLTKSFIHRYQKVPAGQGWGWLGSRKELVMSIAVANYGFYEPDAYLLHGDCGVHNFIFKSRELQCVIDQMPVIGPPTYDLVYAFCSSSDDLTVDTLLEAARSLKQLQPDRKFLIEEVLIQLYCRIGTCLKYHSHQLPDYLEAWIYWKSLIKEGNI